jgi:membrane protein DedA with SNARE-associated domain
MDFLDLLIRLFTVHGYVAVFVVLLICGFGVPIPEDISLVAGGIIAGLGYADLHTMCAVGLAGVLVGDSAVFLVGRVFGVRALKVRWVAHLLTPRRYAQVQAKFARYGNRLMFVARFLPGLRTAVFLTAGMSHRVSFLRFLLLDGVAALLSVPVWVHLGYYGASNREWLLGWIKRGQGGIAAVAVVLVALAAWALWRRASRRRSLLRAHRTRRAARAGLRTDDSGPGPSP